MSISMGGRLWRGLNALLRGFLILPVIGGMVFLAWSVVDDIVDDTQQHEILLARILADDIDQTFHSADILLRALSRRLTPPLAESPSDALAETVAMLSVEPRFYALKVLDAEGRVLAHSADLPDAGSLAHLPTVLGAEARGADHQLRLFPIGRSDLDSRPVMLAARRLDDAAGAMIGIVALSIDLDFLEKIVGASIPLHKRLISVVLPEGTILFNLPKPGSGAAGIARFDLDGENTRHKSRAPGTGEMRIGGYAKSTQGSIVVLSTVDSSEAVWNELLSYRQVILALLGLGLALAAFGGQAARELRRRRRILDDRENLIQSLELADLGVAIADPTGERLIYVSSGFERMSGYAAAELIGGNLRILQGPGTDAATVAKIRDGMAAGIPVRVDILNHAKDGRTYWADMSIAPVRGPGGAIKSFVGAFVDITPRMEMETRLRALLGRAEAANQAKDSFLARMSHELRTPLNAVIGYADLMLIGVKGTLSESHRGYAGDIVASGRHLLAIVDDVLEMARLENNMRSLAREPVDLALEIREAAAIAAVDTAASGAMLEIRTGDVPRALADAQAIRQIAVNLIVNAARHGKPGGRIVVSTDEGAGGWVRLKVADDGPGFPPDMLEEIGEPFVGRASHVADKGGLGLGLAISIELAKRMGGDLTVENAERGALATLTLPARARDSQAA